MSQKFRLEKAGYINRDKEISFKFNGKKYFGYEGDTLASALLANGIHLIGRSFKYHRPRGFVGAGIDEPNAQVQLYSGEKTEPNAIATTIELVEGLIATSQNCWPSVSFDFGEINNLLNKFFPAGFYYKTFMWPKSFWYKIYEPIIRKAAGLGIAPLKPDPDRYEHKFEHCDVLVVGSGPAGLASALAASKNGARVILAEDKPRFGGSLLTDEVTIGNKKGKDWADETIEQLKSMPNVIVKNRSQVFGYYDHNMMVMFEKTKDHISNASKFTPRQRLWYIRAKEVIISTGSIERPLVFGNNDRPGVMLASAAKEFMKVYGVLIGKKPIIFTNNDTGYEAAIEFKNNGIDPLVLDVRKNPEGSIIKEAKNLNIKIRFSYGVINAEGHLRVNKAIIGKLNDDKTGYENIEHISCDSICVSGNWTPTVHLSSQSGNKLKFDDKINAFVPNQSRQNENTIGSAKGTYSLKESLEDGFKAGYELSKKITGQDTKSSVPKINEKKYGEQDKFWCMPVPKNKNYKRCVDFQNDVYVSDIELAIREGFRSIEHVKRYTTLGMATDQGRTSNLNGLQLVANIEKKIVPEVGHTTFRPPFTPVTIGTIVGREVGKHYRPIRKSPIHDWHEKNNAVFVDAGLWVRPRYYKKNNETLIQAAKREATNVRKNVGVCDVTSLGKIDIKGPDAAEFLNRVYTNAWMKLPVGKTRYGLMLREDGIVFDDGTTTRIAENHFHMTTTTAQAANVLAHLEYYLQIVWPELDVNVLSTTEQWAGVAIAGPNSRNLLVKLFPNIDVSNEALPFMGYKEAKLFDIPARIFRISFSGELAYEVNVESNYGLFLWEKIIDLGREMNIEPYGTEALSTLRIEMGHVAGSEIDGRVIASDLSLDGLISKKKDFIGKRSLNRNAFLKTDREKIVGLVPLDKKTMIPEGSHLVLDKNASLPNPKLGHVSASCWSVEFNNPFSLAILQDGKNRIGQKLFAVSPLKNKNIQVEVVSSHYVDPKGERVRS
ncbi:MAG: sarcosine oxidase subunit alpha family protein [Candidatus Pelagibacter sp.]|nr:sarcosine oxidase subunit alpha family protein [Candidatus Pelagibacter sp.]OUU60539.1 MAG: sarcosine oxidase subunit alpha family protein [Proteobacteria bacterium TMED61]|tara:strand:+ start:442 stop:3438 length:2997 start_codon:yes stop_codon:yes gene_type:complete